MPRPIALTLAFLVLLPLSCGVKSANQLLQGGNLDKTLYPLADGRSWTYDVQILGSWPICRGGRIVQSIVGTSVMEGRVAYEISPLCDSTYTSHWSVVGDRFDRRYYDRWQPALDEPVVDNHRWQIGDDAFVWHSRASVTVGATTYAACWMRSQVDSPNDNYEVYCPGVGKVLSHYADVMGNGWHAALVSKSF